MPMPMTKQSQRSEDDEDAERKERHLKQQAETTQHAENSTRDTDTQLGEAFRRASQTETARRIQDAFRRKTGY